MKRKPSAIPAAATIKRAARRSLHPHVGPGTLLRSLKREPHGEGVRPMAEHLTQGLPPLEVRLRTRAIVALAERLTAELGPEPPAFPILAGALTRCADASLGAIERLQSELADLVLAYQRAASPEEQRAVLIDHLRQRGSGAVDATRDVVATSRWLDLEAVQERFATAVADRTDEIEIAHRALAGLAQELDSAPDRVKDLLEARVVPAVLDHAAAGRPPAVRVAALKAASAILAPLAPEDRLSLVPAPLARAVAQWSNGASATRWIQVAALELRTLLFPADAPHVIAERLRDRAGPDGLILRRNALAILASRPLDEGALSIALLARDDPSEHVRQELARLLASAPASGAALALAEIATTDPSARVRGVALRELGRRAADDPEARPLAVQTLTAILARPFSSSTPADDPPSPPADPLVARVALLAIRSLASGASAPCPPDAFLTPVARLIARADLPPKILDEAAATLQLLEVEAAPVLTSLRREIEAKLQTLGEGERAAVRVRDSTEPRHLERALAAAARGDMSVSLRRAGSDRYILTRGEPRAFRLWRFLHEIRTPMPDKRKGFVHTHGRVPAGEITVPPSAMAEVTPTRVPGERQVSAAVDGWGYFLPRVDDLLAACSLAPEPLRLVTPVGTVTVRAPASLSSRLRARARLTLHYARYAEARQGSLDAAEDALRRRFTQMARDLGFSFEIGPVEVAVGDLRLEARPELPTRYLAPLAPFAAPSWTEHVLAYLLSPAGNTPTHLAWVVWVIFGVLLIRAAFLMHRIESARQRIPLTIGGWGTRGKSGCERLKAALFHALRYDVVVKTTGCEAMFIHAMRDMPAQEIFLYRPYDKATIWEQKATLHTAERLGAQVFLWECMALQPRFVDTLENEWMKDPITTLTNAYPDHEDIQGPSGEDVARVIGRFMPEGGRTFTTEEQMIPILREAAKKRGAELVEVPPIEADLLPADLLARLPYNEHPRNVALILELAEALGIDREFALVEMADHVVPDLGVLKTYPTARYRGRSLTFSNGMSANERAGFLSNWTRLSFDKLDKDKTPGVDTVIIVNNRADRVARSRVFAKIVVEDIGVDHILLINSNLGGMLQFIGEALDLRLRSASVTGEGGLPRALERLDAAFLKIGIPSRADAVQDGVSRMLGALRLSADVIRGILEEPSMQAAVREPNGSLGSTLEGVLSAIALPDGTEDIRPEIVLHAGRLADRVARRDAARAEVQAAFERGAPEQADEAFRRAYKSLFMDRVHVLWNVDATGDQVIDFITREIPPGSDARLMGAQNIKGTGLDFVYRWLSLDRVRSSIARMKSDPSSRARELSWMLGYSDYGLLDAREALAFIEEARKSTQPDWAPHAAILEGASRRLTTLVREKEAKLTATGKAGLAVTILGRLEQLIDHLDSMRRTSDASRIMNDLYARRIGHGRAALLMRGVVSRTKGGWLAKDVMAFVSRLQRGREAPKQLAGASKPPALPH